MGYPNAMLKGRINNWNSAVELEANVASLHAGETQNKDWLAAHWPFMESI